MKTRKSGYKIILSILLTLGAALFVVITPVTDALAESGEEDNDENRPEISIEVVEDIPAEDIEESKVPLADPADSAAADITRRTVAVWVIAAVIIAYAVFVLSGKRRRKTRRRLQAGTAGERGEDPEGGDYESVK